MMENWNTHQVFVRRGGSFPPASQPQPAQLGVMKDAPARMHELCPQSSRGNHRTSFVLQSRLQNREVERIYRVD